MRKVSIQQLHKSLAKELQNLPFRIVKYGRIIAIVQENVSTLSQETKENVSTHKKESENVSTHLDKPINIKRKLCPKCGSAVVGGVCVSCGTRFI